MRYLSKFVDSIKSKKYYAAYFTGMNAAVWASTMGLYSYINNIPYIEVASRVASAALKNPIDLVVGTVYISLVATLPILPLIISQADVRATSDSHSTEE